MAQLFRASTNRAARASLWAFALAAMVVASLAVALQRSDWSTGRGWAATQPVPFSHAHHVGEFGIDCRHCHHTVDSDAFAGIPPTSLCMRCHARIWTHADMLAPVRESYASGRPLRWRRVHDLPDFAYFDHSAHTQAGIGCETCHGDVGSMALTVQVAPLTMRWCIDCHADLPARFGRPVDINCSTCHR
jgi:hypothetical protein